MDKSLKETIDNVSRSASNMEDDMEHLEVAPLHQSHLIEIMLMGVQKGVEQRTISAEEVETLRMYWNAFSTNVFMLTHIFQYLRLQLDNREIPEDLQEKIDRWARTGKARRG